MDETPDLESARASDKPLMPSQLIWRPVATTRVSYESVRPEEVVTEEFSGAKDSTFSGMWER